MREVGIGLQLQSIGKYLVVAECQLKTLILHLTYVGVWTTQVTHCQWDWGLHQDIICLLDEVIECCPDTIAEVHIETEVGLCGCLPGYILVGQVSDSYT